MWRHREKRGTYTRLYGEWARTLHLAGLDEEAESLETDIYGTSPAPMRVLIESWDFVELCSGPRAPLSAAIAARGLRVGPRVDLCRSSLWDLRELRIVEYLLFLAEHRRVWHWHSDLPSMSFNIARHPQERSCEHPWGLAPRSAVVAEGNWFMHSFCLP